MLGFSKQDGTLLYLIRYHKHILNGLCLFCENEEIKDNTDYDLLRILTVFLDYIFQDIYQNNYLFKKIIIYFYNKIKNNEIE